MRNLIRTSDTRRRLLAGALLILSSVALGACDDSSTAPAAGDVRVSVSGGTTTVRPGTPVAFTMFNTTSRNFEFNLCTDARLERDNNGTWADASNPPSVCNAIIQLLVPNGRLDASYPLPATLIAGRYRITLTIRDGTSPNIVVSSEPFTVAP